MADEKKPLNLDELFGQARAVKVIKNGREYELMRLEAMGPKQAVRFQKLQVVAAELQSLGDDLTDQQADQVSEALNNMLTILCADLPVDEMTFMEKTRVLQFYIEETQGKKVMELALKKVNQPTGARSSRK